MHQDILLIYTRILNLGFKYELEPPISVEVLRGTVRGRRGRPIKELMEIPGEEYPVPVDFLEQQKAAAAAEKEKQAAADKAKKEADKPGVKSPTVGGESAKKKALPPSAKKSDAKPPGAKPPSSAKKEEKANEKGKALQKKGSGLPKGVKTPVTDDTPSSKKVKPPAAKSIE